MKCWKCGNDLPENASACTGCGASMNRPAPVSAQGRAMRQIFDRFGSSVFAKKSLMPVALGDLLEDAKKLRNQVDTVLSAGVGNLYLEQIRNAGKPDEAFCARVKAMMVDEADLSDKAAAELMGYFDEMIGWAAPTGGVSAPAAAAQSRPMPNNEIPRPTPGQTAPRPAPNNEIPRPAPNQEIPRPTPNNEIPRPSPNKEIPRPAPQPAPPRPQPNPASSAPKNPLPNAPVPVKPDGGTGAKIGRFMYNALLIGTVCAGVSTLLTLLPVGLFVLALALFLYKMKEENLLPQGQVLLKCVRNGDVVNVSWKTRRGDPMRFAIAVDGKWVLTGNGTSAQIQSQGDHFVLAEITNNGVIYRGENYSARKN